MSSSIATDLATVPRIIVICGVVTLRRGVRQCLALLKEETLLPYVLTCVPCMRSRRVDIGLVRLNRVADSVGSFGRQPSRAALCWYVFVIGCELVATTPT